MKDADAASSVLQELHDAILDASSDCFLWSRGEIVWEQPVERLIQVYAARRIFDRFTGTAHQGCSLFLEKAAKQLIPESANGAIDLVAEIEPDLRIAVEFKRYVDNAALDKDVPRLRILASLGWVCFYAAPYFHEGASGSPLPAMKSDPTLKGHFKSLRPDDSAFVADLRPLPECYQDSKGRTHVGSIIIRVAP